MEVASPSTASRSVTLDAPPPKPPGNFMTAQPPPQQGGLGDMANSPTLMTMQGLAMAKDAFQLISNGVPALAPILMNTITDLEQMVVQGLGDAQAGQQPAPPGVAPAMAPPPGAMPPRPPGPPGMAGGGGGLPMGAA